MIRIGDFLSGYDNPITERKSSRFLLKVLKLALDLFKLDSHLSIYRYGQYPPYIGGSGGSVIGFCF